MHTWKMINPLIWFHSIKSIALNSSVTPQNIPIFFFGIGKFHFECLSYAPNHWIMAMIHINVQTSLLVFLFFLFFSSLQFFLLRTSTFYFVLLQISIFKFLLCWCFFIFFSRIVIIRRFTTTIWISKAITA